jgi:hypothetical protein
MIVIEVLLDKPEEHLNIQTIPLKLGQFVPTVGAGMLPVLG